MSYTDAPIPTQPGADFAVWKRYVDEQISRFAATKGSVVIGAITATSDGSGFITFQHGVKTVPKAVFVTNMSDSAGWVSWIGNFTSTTATVRFLIVFGGAIGSYANSSITFQFVTWT